MGDDLYQDTYDELVSLTEHFKDIRDARSDDLDVAKQAYDQAHYDHQMALSAQEAFEAVPRRTGTR